MEVAFPFVDELAPERAQPSPMRPVSRAEVKGDVQCGRELAPIWAERGAYRVQHRGASVCLRNKSRGHEFTLSLDAFVQHVLEGRIALAD